VYKLGKALALSAPIFALFLAAASADDTLSFVTHAAFFSKETHQAKPVDPQVFVRDPQSPAGVGPQGIEHGAGIRPALIDQDGKSTALVNAKGEPLGFDLGHWLAAHGTATVAPQAGGKANITVSFEGLRPNGHYSLFENHFDQKPIGFTPLDGAGEHNNFVADTDGAAKLTVTAPSLPTSANAILLVYHSDGESHGKERGQIGVTAQHQLIAPVAH
jgi:hypothetical protein